MGLDAIEIILTAEDVFSISIDDPEAEQVAAVGQLYELICSKLHLPHSTTHPTGIGRPQLIRKLQITPRLAPRTHEDVWATLVAIFVEQMQLDPAEVRYAARITTDLRVD